MNGTDETRRAPSLTRHLEAMGPIDPAAMDVKEARARLRRYYVEREGYSALPALLTPPSAQPKLRKSVKSAYGLTLAPADMSGWESCLWRTPACTAACVLATGGRSVMAPIRRARSAKTRALGAEPQAFVTLLAHEIDAAVRRHGAIDLRLNVASDLRWERIAPAILDRPGVRAYDYTKAPVGQREPGTVGGEGYALTFSVSERPQSVKEALRWLESGGNAAVVFERMTRSDWDGILPTDWEGFKVIDGDMTDSRRDDEPGTVVGLRAKGSAIGAPGSDEGFVKPGRRA